MSVWLIKRHAYDKITVYMAGYSCVESENYLRKLRVICTRCSSYTCVCVSSRLRTSYSSPTTARWSCFQWRCCWPPVTATAALSCATRAAFCCRARTAGAASARSTWSACARDRSTGCTWLISLMTRRRRPSSVLSRRTNSSVISPAGTTSSG